MKTLLSIDEFERLPEPEQGGGYELGEALSDDKILPGFSLPLAVIFAPVG